MSKKILAALLAVMMVLSLVPMTAGAAAAETATDAADVAVTEVGAFPSADAFKAYINGTYYLNNGAGVQDVAQNTMFVRLSKSLPKGYKLYVFVLDSADKTLINAKYIESPNSFAYFANETYP